MSEKEDKILGIMHRLGLQKTENGLTTYIALREIWDTAQESLMQELEDHDVEIPPWFTLDSEKEKP